MDIDNHIKKAVTEGIVKAILENAGYQVNDLGIEHQVPAMRALSKADYARLAYPDALRQRPDFDVLDRQHGTHALVEVKYRSNWGLQLFGEIARQVEIFGELVLVSINANPPNDKQLHYASTYLRCCRVKFEDGALKVQLKGGRGGAGFHHWQSLEQITRGPDLWWAMSPLPMVFTRIDARSGSLESAKDALAGLLNTRAPGAA